MKKSHIDWCPLIPDHWEEKRIKDIAFLQSGSSITAMDIAEEGPYPVYGGNGMRGYTNRFTNEGDHVLIGRQGALCGNINYAHGKFYATEHAVVMYTHNDEITYWLGETLRAANLNRLSMTAAQPGLAVSTLNLQFIPYPPREERIRIANYLKAKLTDIDSQITLLTSKRDAYLRLKKSIINHAVTKGLNPGVKMKASGVDWIGEIPGHWERKRLKDIAYLYSGLTGKAGDDFRCDDISKTKPYIPFTNILNNLKIDAKKLPRVVMSAGENQNKVRQNDLLFLMSSEDYESIAKSAVVMEDMGEVYLNSFCRGLHFTSNKIYANFINYQLQAQNYRDALRFEARGFTRINIKVDRISSMYVSLPPLPEQQAIAAYLDEKCSKIDKIVANLEKQINLYTDLKRSLIDEVITGKRAV